MNVLEAQRVDVNVLTMTGTVVANTVLNMLLRAVHERGLPPDYLNDTRKLIENGLGTWATQQTLRAVMLEVSRESDSSALERFIFPVIYQADPNMEVRQPPTEPLRELCHALKQLPPDAKYRVLADLAEGASKVPGWEPTTPKNLNVTQSFELPVWGFGNASLRMIYQGGEW